MCVIQPVNTTLYHLTYKFSKIVSAYLSEKLKSHESESSNTQGGRGVSRVFSLLWSIGSQLGMMVNTCSPRCSRGWAGVSLEPRSSRLAWATNYKTLSQGEEEAENWDSEGESSEWERRSRLFLWEFKGESSDGEVKKEAVSVWSHCENWTC